MDRRLSNLERRTKIDPQLAPQLASEYLRSSRFLISDNRCQLSSRGIFEGDYFGCFAVLLAIAQVYDSLLDSEWDDYLEERLESWVFPAMLQLDFEILTSMMNWPPASSGLVGRDWQHYQQVSCFANKITWLAGQARRGYGVPQWQTVPGPPGTPAVTISFHHGQQELELPHAPTCRVIYNNPTTSMAAMLCSLNPKFFVHRSLPPVPPAREQFFEDVETPLRWRGNLTMLNCQQLRESYYRRFPMSDPEQNHWMHQTRGIGAVGIVCPTCGSVYSVHKDAEEDTPEVYCDNCEYYLLEGFYDTGSHLRHFARIHASHVNESSQLAYGADLDPVHIPSDCSALVRNQIIDYLEERGCQIAPRFL